MAIQQGAVKALTMRARGPLLLICLVHETLLEEESVSDLNLAKTRDCVPGAWRKWFDNAPHSKLNVGNNRIGAAGVRSLAGVAGAELCTQ